MIVKFLESSEDFQQVEDLTVVEVITPNGFRHLFYFKEVCGLRLQSQIVEPDENFDYRRISSILQIKKFDVIQLITKPRVVIKGFFCTNQIYERLAGEPIVSSRQLFDNMTSFELKDGNKELDSLAFAELITRFELPGSTVFGKDNFISTRHDQIGLTAFKYTNDRGRAYVLSFATSPVQRMISFFWSDAIAPSGLGQKILVDHLANHSNNNFIYFVSILNIPAMKVLSKNGFTLKYEIWNYTF